MSQQLNNFNVNLNLIDIDSRAKESLEIVFENLCSSNCFFYSKLIECAAMEILRPDEYFVWGGSLPRLLERVGQ